ncbi:hypothetical protein BJV74DRAFT_793473, partial [Russula compacta]
MNPRHLTHSYAVGNLETMDVDPPLVDSGASTTSKKHTAAEAEISGGETEPASNVPVKVKQGRPAGSKNKPKVAQAPEMVNNTRKSADVLPEKRPAVQVVPQPQPIWQTQVVDPAGPDRPQPRRSSAELQEELKELNKRKIQAMAEMDVQEELEDEEDECLRATHISNTASMDGVDDIEEFSDKDQENHRSEVASNAEESQDSEEVVQAIMRAPAKRTSRTKKAAKGATRLAVEVATQVVKAKNKRKWAKKHKATFPSGLVHNWETKVKASMKKDTGSAKTRKADAESKPSISTSSFDIGGLTDDDAFAVAPPLDLSRKNCNPNRTNE